MKPTAENLLARRKFLDDDLYNELSKSTETETDYFTQSKDYPTTFKIGKCVHMPDASNAFMQVQLYWHSEEGSQKKDIQKEVWVDFTEADNYTGIPGWYLLEVTSKPPSND